MLQTLRLPGPTGVASYSRVPEVIQLAPNFDLLLSQMSTGHSHFTAFLARRYPLLKADPASVNEGRRKLKLQALAEFWSSLTTNTYRPVDNQEDHDSVLESISKDPDPFDVPLEEDQIGILLRTDYSDQDKWNAFLEEFRSNEESFLRDMMSMDDDGTPSAEGDSAMAVDEGSAGKAEEGSLSDSDDDDSSLPSFIFVVDYPSSTPERAQVDGISNLTALRLFNEVNVRTALKPPPNTKRVSPRNRLIEKNDLQEVYEGPTVWIYDSISNSDSHARLVSSVGPDLYGTATGDSWRVKVSHIPELQWHMIHYGMKVDFGGLDRWDLHERQKNMQEAEQ